MLWAWSTCPECRDSRWTADRRPLLPGGYAAVRPADAAADAGGVAHRQPRGAVPHPRRHRFKELIGVTPKRLARTYRFTAAVFAINPAEPIDWGALAGGAGYFDQAHFGHEFRAFTGLTPTRYVEVRRRFLREHPGHALDGWPLPAD
jgi:hypothetical protein